VCVQKGCDEMRKTLLFAVRAAKRACPPLLSLQQRQSPGGGLRRPKHPCSVSAGAIMERAVREPHGVEDFPVTRGCPEPAVVQQGCLARKPKDCSDGSGLTDPSPMVTARSCSRGSFQGRYACWELDPLAPVLPWQAGVQSLASPRVLVPQALPADAASHRYHTISPPLGL